MALSPMNNNFIYVQTYTALYYEGPGIATYKMTDATGSVPYQKGMLVSLYTVDTDGNTIINYDTTGDDGQDTILGVISDDQTPYTTTPPSGQLVKVQFWGPVTFQAPALVATQGSGDVTTGMTALGGKYNAKLDAWHLG